MFDAYEVAIKLRLTDQLSGAMGMINRHLLEGNQHAEKLQKRLDGIGKMFRTGFLVTGAGFGLAAVLKASTNEAVRFEQQMNRLKALNLDNRFGAGSTSGLAKLSQSIAAGIKGTTSTEALRLVTETQSITGDLRHTAELAPLLAKMRFGIETYMSANGNGEGHGANAERQFNDIVKVMEMRGLMRNFSEERMMSMADLFTKSFVASGGMVKPSDFLAMMKTGGTAAKSVGDDFMFALGHIMQEKGGSRSGTALMSTYQNLVAGRMPQQIAETLKKLGLLDPKAIHYGTTGHITKVDAGGLKDSQLLMSRPDLYLQRYILPAIAKSGVNMSDQNAVLMKLNSMAGHRTASDFLAQMYLEQGQIGNYVAQAKNAMGVNALYGQSAGSTTGDQADLMAKINQLELEFGTVALPLVKSALEQAIPLVKDFGTWLEKHPDGLSMLVKSIAGLSVAMMVSGPLMMIGSGIRLLSVAATLSAAPLGRLAVAMAFSNIGGASGIASIAGSLSTVGGQLALLGKIAGVAGAAMVGWAVGTKIYDSLSTDTQNTIGGTIATILAKFGSKDAQEALDAEMRYRSHSFALPPSRNKSSGGHGDVILDGHKVGQVMAPHFAKQAASATNTGGIDSGLMMPLPGMNY